MSACCDPSGCRRMFDARHAERNARDFRKKGLDANATRLMRAVERVTADKALHTPDLGGSATTAEVTEAVVRAIKGDNE